MALESLHANPTDTQHTHGEQCVLVHCLLSMLQCAIYVRGVFWLVQPRFNRDIHFFVVFIQHSPLSYIRIVLQSTMRTLHLRLPSGVHRSTCQRSITTIKASQAAAQQPSEFRSCLITGANTGIGLETALATARAGYYTVLACRDQAKAEAAKNKIKYKEGHASCW